MTHKLGLALVTALVLAGAGMLSSVPESAAQTAQTARIFQEPRRTYRHSRATRKKGNAGQRGGGQRNAGQRGGGQRSAGQTRWGPAARHKPTARHEPASRRQPTAQRQPTTRCQPTAQHQPAARRQPTAQHQPAARRQPTAHYHPAARHHPAARRRPAQIRQDSGRQQSKDRWSELLDLAGQPSRAPRRPLANVRGARHAGCRPVRLGILLPLRLHRRSGALLRRTDRRRLSTPMACSADA